MMNSAVGNGAQGSHDIDKNSSSAMVAIDTDLLGNVEIVLEARLGEASMTVANLLDLRKGSSIELTSSVVDHAALYLNNKLIARGEIVAIGDRFGIRVTQLGADT
jgi:flagellar motor switch protein FliN/FliY